jgi:serine/threonine-protein kinase HipA
MALGLGSRPEREDVSALAGVNLWGRAIGAVSLDEGAPAAVFQYEPAFVPSGIQVAPLTMPLRPQPYSFPELPSAAFKGLPGLLADSLPDKYGNALIDTWLAGQGREPGSASAIERLSYIGRRGMGALEFEPVKGPSATADEEIHIGALVELASRILSHREDFVASLREGREGDAMREILSVGMSAGGARAKAVIAWNPATREIRSGQVDAPPGFEHWLLKFDGVGNNKDKEELADPEGYGAVEFAYAKMAAAAGVDMPPCQLLTENGRRHFMVRRFDRPSRNDKLHMQSLAALAHYDLNQAGAYSYEQALMAIRRLGLPMADVERQVRRMAFNVIARNQDDHVKNIAFLMDRGGEWSLSPAFDVTYAYSAHGTWTAQHQMSINGKRDHFTIEDFERCAESVSMQRGRAAEIAAEVRDAVAEWPAHAAAVGVAAVEAERIASMHRLDLPRR